MVNGNGIIFHFQKEWSSRIRLLRSYVHLKRRWFRNWSCQDFLKANELRFSSPSLAVIGRHASLGMTSYPSTPTRRRVRCGLSGNWPLKGSSGFNLNKYVMASDRTRESIVIKLTKTDRLVITFWLYTPCTQFDNYDRYTLKEIATPSSYLPFLLHFIAPNLSFD